MDLWFREINVPRAWPVYLATGFDFWEKTRAGFGSIGAGRCHQPPTLPLYYEEKVKKTMFSPKLCVHIKDNNSPHGKFHRFLFPFSCKL